MRESDVSEVKMLAPNRLIYFDESLKPFRDMRAKTKIKDIIQQRGTNHIFERQFVKFSKITQETVSKIRRWSH